MTIPQTPSAEEIVILESVARILTLSLPKGSNYICVAYFPSGSDGVPKARVVASVHDREKLANLLTEASGAVLDSVPLRVREIAEH